MHHRITQNRIWFALIVSCLLSLSVFAVLKNNNNWYQEPIGIVTHVETKSVTHDTDEFNNRSKDVTQILTVKAANTKARQSFKRIQIVNQYNSSEALDHAHRTHDHLLLRSNGKHHWLIQDTKRDYLYLPVIIFALTFLVSFLSRMGIKIVCSLLFSFAGFLLFINSAPNLSDNSAIALALLFCILSNLVTTTTIFGIKNRKGWTIFSATVITLIFLTLICVLTLPFIYQYFSFEYFEHYYISISASLIISIILAANGAILDAETDISGTILSYLETHRRRQHQEKIVWKIQKNIGGEIINALSHIILFIFLSAQIPLTLLFLKNGNGLGYTLKMTLYIGLLETFISTVGILIAMPIGSWLIILTHRKPRHQKKRRS